jgi:hypothetical protein
MSPGGVPEIGSKALLMWANTRRGRLGNTLTGPHRVTLGVRTGGAMIVIPIPVNRYLQPLLDAAGFSGYVGLVFVLARTADAPDQHEDLARYWTSLHDVTGPLIGLLCPSPTGDPRESRVIRRGTKGTGVGVQGLMFERASKADDEKFARAFWDAASQDARIRDAMGNYEPPEIIVDRPPLPPKELAAAWTEVTTESAQYFGIAEDWLPCVLIMSLRERTSLVVRLRPGLSIYKLLRGTIRSLGDEPARIAALHERQNELAEELRTIRRRDDHMAYRNWKAKIEQLDAAIGASVDLDAGIRARCQTALRRVLETSEPGDAPAALVALHQQMPVTGDRLPLRHSAVWGLMKQLTESGTIPPRPSDLDRVEALESEHAEAKESERAMREHLLLASAVITAYGQEFVVPTVVSGTGRGGLQGWTVQYVDCMETLDLTTDLRHS